MSERFRCIFNNQELIALAFPDGDPNPCGGQITRHHVKAKREGGNGANGNLQWVCNRHHHWINQEGELEAEIRERVIYNGKTAFSLN